MKNQLGLLNATIHLLKMKFRIGTMPEHYITEGNKLKYVPENRPSRDFFYKVFENIFNEEIKAALSIKGFIEREIKQSEKYKENIGMSNEYFFDLLTEWIEYLERKKEAPQQTETKGEQPNNTDFVVKYLSELKTAFNCDADYCNAVNIVRSFFLPKKIAIKTPIFVKNGNIKNMAFAMGEIWRSQKNEIITYEYLLLYKQLFSIFNGQNIDKNNLFGNNLYKYSISKT